MSGDGRFGRVATALLALVGTTALALSLMVALVPGLAPTGAIESVLADRTLLLVAAVGLATTTGYVVLVGGDEADEQPNVRIPVAPSAAESDRSDVDTPGDWVDERLEKVGGERDVDSRVGLATVKKRIRERIAEVAVEVIVDTESCSRRTAHEKLRDGTWTDRARARVFLGGSDAGNLPLSVRIGDWASGEAFERQVQATVEELADLAGVESGESLAPEPAPLQTDTEEGTQWQPRRDPRAEEWEEGTGDSGLYRRDMFGEDGDVAELDLDGGDQSIPSDGTATASESGAERVETGGERT